MNYRTGLQLNWTDYALAATNAGCNLAAWQSNSSAYQSVICRDKKPLTDTAGIFVTESPCDKVRNMAVALGNAIYEERIEKLLTDFEALYRAKCLAAASLEKFTVTYTSKEYHYTLYYYDMAGNLVKTVPPKGVKPDYSSTFITRVTTARAQDNVVVPAHTFATNYRYNSLNQVVAQKTPDAGRSQFWYDRLGRLAISRNKQQEIDGRYSYTLYDSLGRITEVGQKPHTVVMSQTISQNPVELNRWINETGGVKEQITGTVYDQRYAAGAIDLYLTQKNLRNRVSYTYTKDRATDVSHYTATFYDYDIHGNVDSLLQDYRGITEAVSSGNQFKLICYQ